MERSEHGNLKNKELFNLNRKKICEGVYFTSIVEKKFKTNRISFNFLTPLNENTVSANAILPFLLERSTNEITDFTQLKRKLSSLYGASLSGDVRKIGDRQIINLSVGGIDNSFALENENVTKELSKILSSAAIKPNFNALSDAEAYKTEQRNLIDLIESEINDKRSYTINRLIEIMFENEPYGIRKYGKSEQVSALTGEQVTKAYQELLQSAEIEIIFTGRSGHEIAMQEFQDVFKNMKRTPPQVITNNVVGDVACQKNETEQKSVTQSKMALGFRTGIKADSKESAAARLMTAVYGGTPFSLLFLNVREKLSLCYYCAARFDRTKGVITVDCGVEKDNIEKAKDEILTQLNNLKAGEFSDDELKHASMSVVNSLKTVTDSLSGLEIWYLGQICYGLDFTPLQEAEIINNITREDILSAAEKVKLDTVFVLTDRK